MVEFFRYLSNLFIATFWNPNHWLLSSISWFAFLYATLNYFIPSSGKRISETVPNWNKYKMVILLVLIFVSIIIAAYTIQTKQASVFESNNAKSQSQILDLQSQLKTTQDMLDIAKRASGSSIIVNVPSQSASQPIAPIQYSRVFGYIINQDTDERNYQLSDSKDSSVLYIYAEPYRYPVIKVKSWQLNILDNGLRLPMKKAIPSGGTTQDNMFVITIQPVQMNIFFEYINSGLSGKHLVELVAITENNDNFSSDEFTVDFR